MTGARRTGSLVLRASLPLALEGAGLAALAWGTRPAGVLALVAGHVGASLAAMMLWPYLPRIYREGEAPRRKLPDQPAEDQERLRQAEARRRRWRGRIMLAALVLFLPGFGLLGLLAALLPALHLPIVQRKRDWRRFAIPPLPASPDEHAGPQAPGRTSQPLLEVLQSEGSSADERVAAVLALRHLPTRAAVPILREALCDSSDDVRLLAYAMLDRRDAELQARIQEHARALEKGGRVPGEVAARHYALAQLHWELVHSGLAVGAVRERALDSAVRHARAALAHASPAGPDPEANPEPGPAAGPVSETNPEPGPTAGPEAGAETQAATLYLLGRALLARGVLDQAERMLAQARERGMAETSIQPFLAEIAFLQRRFADVRLHLEASRPGGHDRPGVVADLCRFWLATPESARA